MAAAALLPTLTRLLDELPEPAFPFPDQDTGSRGALAILVAGSLNSLSNARLGPRQAVTEGGRTHAYHTCPNCGEPSDSDRTPYCRDTCKEQSAIVRQVRGNLASGAIFNQERQIAFGEKLWRILGGGYPRRTARLTERQREKIFQREGGKCQSCGAPATVIDHCGSG